MGSYNVPVTRQTCIVQEHFVQNTKTKFSGESGYLPTHTKKITTTTTSTHTHTKFIGSSVLLNES